MNMDRRSFLGVLPGAALAARYVGSGVDSSRAGALDAVGVQVYTLREEMAADAGRTLAEVARIGYTEVELFGPYGLAGREMRAQLDDAGLRAASSHVGINAVRQSWDATLDSAQALAQSLIVVPSLPGHEHDVERRRVAQGASRAVTRALREFNRAGEAAKAVGIRFGYHNHQWEVTPGADGVRPIDVLMEHTDPALVDWQMDIFWAVDGGADPLAEIERYPGRITSVHVKDRTSSGEMVDVGDGVIDFRTILSRAEAAGLRHQFVEHDRPGDAIESIRRSFAGVKALRG